VILRALFLAGLLFAIVVSAYILSRYLQRALRGNGEARWLGRHVTAIAVSHLLLLGWTTLRFLAHGDAWSLPWVVALGVILAISDYAIWQMYKYRRWREAPATAKEPT
jgi:type VI protein secretion system component VasK